MSASSTVAPATAETTSTEPARPRIGADVLAPRLDAYVASYGAHWGEAYRFSGFVMVAQAGEPVYAKGFGSAVRGTDAVPTADTTFRIGSVTKQFTAAAIVELQEQGRLRVDDTVRVHLPDYPEAGDRITLHQLLTHTAGVWSYTSDVAWMKTEATKPHTLAQMLAIFAEAPLEFEPGAQFRYSNSGYVLLGAIIEAASGQTYAEFLQRALFEPAGLTRTSYGDGAVVGDVAEGYVVGIDERIVPASPIDMSVPHAAGAIRSTANDLVAWSAALSGETILSEASKAQLYRVEESSYAYGWVVDEIGGHTRIGHNGGINGFESFYARVPDLGLVVVAWTNHEGFPLGEVGEAALRLAVGEPVARHEETPVVPLEPSTVSQLAGGYVMTTDARAELTTLGVADELVESFSVIDLRIEGDQLTLVPLDETALRVFMSGPATLFVKNPYMEIAVDLDDDGGEVPRLTVASGGLQVSYARDDGAAKKARSAVSKRPR